MSFTRILPISNMNANLFQLGLLDGKSTSVLDQRSRLFCGPAKYLRGPAVENHWSKELPDLLVPVTHKLLSAIIVKNLFSDPNQNKSKTPLKLKVGIFWLKANILTYYAVLIADTRASTWTGENELL